MGRRAQSRRSAERRNRPDHPGGLLVAPIARVHAVDEVIRVHHVETRYELHVFVSARSSVGDHALHGLAHGGQRRPQGIGRLLGLGSDETG